MPITLSRLPMPEIQALCRRYHVKELSLFGSALREDFRPESDLDFLVEFLPESRIGLLAFSRMQRELSGLVGRRVDLVPKEGLKPIIRQSVLESAKVIYEE